MGRYLIESGPSGSLAPWLAREVLAPGGLDASDRETARRCQEWLVLHGFRVLVDGDYGPATTRAMRDFQRGRGLAATGRVDADTFSALVSPLRAALLDHTEEGATLSEAMVSQAQAHLRSAPREVGGRNRGPWVRAYMDGQDGPECLWCGGFVRLLMRQAAEALGKSLPVPGSASCDEWARQGQRAAFFVSGSEASPGRVKPGAIFLTKKAEGDWIHTGIVVRALRDCLVTIEGNTNDDGSREGVEVCERTRGYGGKDFLVFPD